MGLYRSDAWRRRHRRTPGRRLGDLVVGAGLLLVGFVAAAVVLAALGLLGVMLMAGR